MVDNCTEIKVYLVVSEDKLMMYDRYTGVGLETLANYLQHIDSISNVFDCV